VRTDGAVIREIPLVELYPPDFHPFQVNDDAAMDCLAGNIKEYGVRELTDDEAAFIMVDSNLLHRERILPSEKAWAYKIKMEALNHNSVKGEQHSFQVMETQTGESKNQIFRVVRLTELIEALMNMMDTKKLAFNPTVELSHLSILEQAALADAMAKYDVKPSLSQAVRLKKLKQAGTLTIEMIDSLLAEDKKPPKGETAGSIRFRKFFPPEYSKKQIETVITGLLRDWQAAQKEARV
jgi:ParB family chromosome partitioning protein